MRTITVAYQINSFSFLGRSRTLRLAVGQWPARCPVGRHGRHVVWFAFCLELISFSLSLFTGPAAVPFLDLDAVCQLF